MKRRVLITGGTSGLGHALVQEALSTGWAVTASGRRAEADLPAGVAYLRGDVTTLEHQLELAAAGPFERLVLNAGLPAQGDFFALELGALRALMQTNLVAPIQIAHTMGPTELRLVGSAAAFAPMPQFAAYAASKAGLAAFARALWGEQGKVQHWVPAGLNTPMHPEPQARFQTAEAAARSLWRQAETGRAQAYPELKARLLDQVSARLLDQGHARRPLKPRRALVTGSAQGLGAALLQALRTKGCEAVGLDLVEGADLQLDLSLPDAPKRLVEQLTGQAPFDLLVHNAGVTWTGDFYAMDFSDIGRILQVNALAPLELTLALRQAGLLSRGAGMVTVSSLSHQIGYPYAAVYAAAKSTMAVWASLLGRGTDLEVLNVFPGPMATAQAEVGRLGGPPAKHTQAPERVAEAIVGRLAGRGGVLVPQTTNRLLAFAGQRLVPLAVTAAFGRQQRQFL